MRGVLERVQNELFDVGADISVPFGIADRLRINQAQIDALEADCDRFNADLPELKELRPARRERARREAPRRDLLPAGGARRSRRVRARRDQPARDRLPEPAFHLLFILARTANPGTETLWKPGSSR